MDFHEELDEHSHASASWAPAMNAPAPSALPQKGSSPHKPSSVLSRRNEMHELLRHQPPVGAVRGDSEQALVAHGTQSMNQESHSIEASLLRELQQHDTQASCVPSASKQLPHLQPHNDLAHSPPIVSISARSYHIATLLEHALALALPLPRLPEPQERIAQTTRHTRSLSKDKQSDTDLGNDYDEDLDGSALKAPLPDMAEDFRAPVNIRDGDPAHTFKSQFIDFQ